MNTISDTGTLISSVEAGKRFGYTNDYIARLAREQKILGRQSGRQWYVDANSLREFLEKSKTSKKEFAEKVRESRREERAKFEENAVRLRTAIEASRVSMAPRAATLVRAGIVMTAGVLVGALFYTFSPFTSTSTLQTASLWQAVESFAFKIYTFGKVPAAEPNPIADTFKPTPEAMAEELPKAGAGIVVYPESDTSISESEIKNSFSDEVSVTSDQNGNGGVIQPHFQSGEGEAYRYLIVPVDPE